jgi:predicted SnoaL-like aldol condensation-catalyzing enzyme
MSLRTAFLVGCALVLPGSGIAGAQTPAAPVQMNPTPGCQATPEQLAANKKVAMAFFTAATPADQVALADPSYKQHNPVFVKRGAADQVSDYTEFKQTLLNMGRRGPPPSPPGMPAGNSFAVVTAECDIVTMIHERYMQDPTAPPGTYYPTFSFDTFRVTNGKLTEHWDGATIQAPAGAPPKP